MSDIFLSYAREDQELAKAIVDVLIEKGWSVWWDRDLVPGENYQEEINRALREAKCALVLWSPHSVAKPFVTSEADRARVHEKLVAVHTDLDPKEAIPVPFNLTHSEDLSDWDGTAEFKSFTRLLEAIEEKSRRELDTDVILIHRLESLQDDLERVEKVRDYVQDIKDLFTDESSAQLWNEIIGEAKKHIKTHKGTVESILRDVSRPDAQPDTWKNYNETLRDCGEFFYETMELLTGLVLRDSLFQHAKEERSRTSHVYRIADEMIKRAAELTNKKSFRTAVPAYPDSITTDRISRTVLCLVRLRFPGWSTWHLPLLAYEYGRLLFGQDKEYFNFRGYPGAGLSTELDQLFSDAFATYYVGPAYAYVVTYLQLNPSAKLGDEAERAEPSIKPGVDAERAEVVFRTLDYMSQDENEDPYREVIEDLRRDWTVSTSCARKEPDELPELSKEKIDSLSEIAKQTVIGMRVHYNVDLRYPAEHPHQGWRESQDWANQWQEQLRNGQKLEIPRGAGPLNSLRDVLNAGWICRVKFNESIDELAAIMEESCRNIMIMERPPVEEDIEQVTIA